MARVGSISNMLVCAVVRPRSLLLGPRQEAGLDHAAEVEQFVSRGPRARPIKPAVFNQLQGATTSTRRLLFFCARDDDDETFATRVLKLSAARARARDSLLNTHIIDFFNESRVTAQL